MRWLDVAAHPKRREERVKLFATFLNGLAIAGIVGGLIGPVFTGRTEAWLALGGVLLGLALHAGAQLVLHWVVKD